MNADEAEFYATKAALGDKTVYGKKDLWNRWILSSKSEGLMDADDGKCERESLLILIE